MPIDKTGCGFQINFKNGYTASVIWGPGTYSDSHSVEVAAWNTADHLDWVHNEFIPPHDDVRGYLPLNELGAFLTSIANMENANA